jgi:hypothetical protein
MRIACRLQHEKSRSVHDELIEMLRRAEIEFDERYLECPACTPPGYCFLIALTGGSRCAATTG